MQLGEDEADEYSDNAFGFQLKNVHPEGAKLSKKSLQIVNVFLGLGLPWVIATFYESAKNGEAYFVPAGSLGFSVVVFIVCAVLCIICLLVRRCKVGGELGGSRNGRIMSLIFLASLWFIYIIMSVLQAYEVGGAENWESLTFGIKAGVTCPYK